MRTPQKGIRGGTRIPIELPVSIRWRSQAGIERRAEAKIGNISGNGLFIRTKRRWRPDTKLHLTVLFPPEVTNVPIHLYCEGRVVRQQARTQAAGVGVVIDDYNLLASSQRALRGRVRYR